MPGGGEEVAMVMLTTCPACHTRFRVTPEQLGAHGGDVRCGRCAKVFNAHAYLEHEAEEPQPEKQASLPFEGLGEQAAPPEQEPAPQVAVVEEFFAEELPVSPPVEEAASPQEGAEFPPEPPAEAEPAPPAQEQAPVAEIPEFPEPQPAPETPAPVEPVAAAAAAPEKPVQRHVPTKAEPKKPSFLWLWLAGSLLLLLVLGVQGLYFFRSDLAARYPDLRPMLQQLCGVLNCTIRLPANPDLLSIEASNLEADPQQANLVTLNAILRNRARLAQEYPLVELTLTDTQDQMIARRIFPPKEYAKNADLNRGMPPNEEVTARLYLDLGDLKASGYRIFLFYSQ